jgi:hypothetical protein
MGNFFSPPSCNECECRWVRAQECVLVRRGAPSLLPTRPRAQPPNFSQWLQQAAQTERRRRGSRSRSRSRSRTVLPAPRNRSRTRSIRPVDVPKVVRGKKVIKTPEAPTECPLCGEETKSYTRCPFCKQMWCPSCDKKLYAHPKTRYVNNISNKYIACPFCRHDLASDLRQ